MMSECEKRKNAKIKRRRKSKAKNPRQVNGWNNRTQFGDRAGKSRQTIWRWERAGFLPAPDGHTPNGDPLWRDSTIDNFLAGNSVAA